MSDSELTAVPLATNGRLPEVRYAFTGSSGYMFPRPDGIVLGGTFELDQWSTAPEPEAIAQIIASHREFFDGFRCTA